MGIDSNVSLLLAGMDLKLVQLLRAAMNNGPAGGGGAGVHAAGSIQSRRVHQPEPRIEPRRVIEPAARFEPRKVHHPEPTFAPRPHIPAPETPRCSKSVLPPPWKTVPLEMPVEPQPVIKQVKYKVDTIHKGSLIDIFM